MLFKLVTRVDRLGACLWGQKIEYSICMGVGRPVFRSKPVNVHLKYCNIVPVTQNVSIKQETNFFDKNTYLGR